MVITKELVAFTMEILSHVLSESLEVDFVLKTIEQLLETHGRELTDQVMIHSDQGFHYTSVHYRKLLTDSNLRQSMSRRGNCWDNAPQESFFGHMKQELALKQKRWKDFNQVHSDVDDWIDYYNNDRGQWPLLKLSPTEYFNYTKTGIYPLVVK